MNPFDSKKKFGGGRAAGPFSYLYMHFGEDKTFLAFGPILMKNSVIVREEGTSGGTIAVESGTGTL